MKRDFPGCRRSHIFRPHPDAIKISQGRQFRHHRGFRLFQAKISAYFLRRKQKRERPGPLYLQHGSRECFLNQDLNEEPIRRSLRRAGRRQERQSGRRSRRSPVGPSLLRYKSDQRINSFCLIYIDIIRQAVAYAAESFYKRAVAPELFSQRIYMDIDRAACFYVFTVPNFFPGAVPLKKQSWDC